MRVLGFVLVLLGGAAESQDDRLRDLLRKLDDDSIEVRARAAAAIVALGQDAVKPLQDAMRGSRGELRERVIEILRKIEDRRRLASLLPPPKRITLRAAGKPLREVFEELARQASTPLDAAEVPEDEKVTVSLDAVPFWKAVDLICRASGKVMADAEADRVVVTPQPYVALPGRTSDAFSATLQQIEITSRGEFGGADQFDQTRLSVQIAWEKGTRPYRISASLAELTDDKGNDLMGLAEENEEAFICPVAPEAIRQEFALGTPRRPGPDATRLARARVEISLDFPLKHAEAKFDFAKAAPLTEECAEFAATILRVNRVDGTLTLDLSFVSRSPKVEGLSAEEVTLRDKEGNEYLGIPEESGKPENATTYQLSFLSVPEKAVLKELVIRIPTEIHTERFDLDLKDVPLK